MSQQHLPHIEQHLRHDLRAIQSSQVAQATWLGQQQQGQAGVSAPLPYSSGLVVRGDSDYLDGATQSRVEDWASQACAATLEQQGMTEGPTETGQIAGIAPDSELPPSPAHSTASQQLFQQQAQQQAQLQAQQQAQQLLLNQQQAQQQAQLPAQQQHQQNLHQNLQQQNLNSYSGHISGLGLPYGSHMPHGQIPPGQLQGGFVPGQNIAGTGANQLPAYSDAMHPVVNLGQLNGVQQHMLSVQPPASQKPRQQTGLVGQIPANMVHATAKEHRVSGGSGSSIPPSLSPAFGLGMVGQLPDHILKGQHGGAAVGQFPHGLPASYGFQPNYLGQPMNLPIGSNALSHHPSGASLSNFSQFSFAPPFGVYPPGAMPAPSHAGSLDGSAYNVPDSASVMSQRPIVQQIAPSPVSLASLGTVQKVKVLCSSGGRFKHIEGGMEYTGGETRLVSVSNDCHMAELRDALHRVSQTMRLDLSGSSATASVIKYQLPGSNNTYVDLVDDEDVKLMFDEWADHLAAEGKAARTLKLHMYIDWQSSNKRGEAGMPSGGPAIEQRQLDTISETASATSADTPVARAPPPPTGDMDGPRSHEESPHGQSNSAGSATAVPASASEFSLQRIASTMEIIDPRDITLVKFLGSGGYGEVHLGKWHSSEAAIKCLNPSLFFQGGEAGGQAAIAELIKEATLLSSMRHPNVVWVYGIVLRPLKGNEEEDDDDDLLDRDNGDAVELAAALARQPPTGGAGVVRPPAIVVEYMGQGSLKGALARKADIVQGALIRVLIAMDAAKGMEYLHQKRIVHFDLKSANLLLGYKDRRAICKVADFGLSKQKRDTYVSNVSSQRGTLPWIAPEIIKTPNAVTEKVDVYSFGVVLWELWTGREPYDGLNYHALLHQITTSKGLVRPPMPNSPEWEHGPLAELVPGYKQLIEACWDEAPMKRPTFREIVNRLKVMAQLLRPPPKRRASQIASQASAGSQSIPSQPAANSANAGTLELAVGEAKSILSPRGQGTLRPPLCSPTKATDPQQGEKASMPASSQRDEKASTQVEQAPTQTEPAAAAAAPAADDVSETKATASEEVVSPFEQVQEPSAAVAAAKTVPQTASPFADAS